MNSFPVELEPAACPRLAAGLGVLHLAAALLPWVTRCAALTAVSLSGLAVAGLWLSIVRTPGAHNPLRRVACRHGQWYLWLGESGPAIAAVPGPGTRVYSGWVVLDLRAGGSRFGWLLPRPATSPDDFRHLKARLRLAC